MGRSDYEKHDPFKDEYFIHVGTEEEKLEDPMRKKVVAFSFGKEKPRFDDQMHQLTNEIAEMA